MYKILPQKLNYIGKMFHPSEFGKPVVAASVIVCVII